MTRGDSAYIRIPIDLEIDEETYEYEMQEGDQIIFSVKKKYTDEEYLIHKTFTENIVHLTPSDTRLLDYGKYDYDVEINMANGDIFTIVPKSQFTVEAEVTRDGN